MDEQDPTLTYSEQPQAQWAGKYRVVGRIGQGGMGVVYKGLDEDLGRTVALKFLPPELDGDSASAQRFLREARAASALDHPNIGTIYGVEETPDGRRFIVMAYYDGQNLSERLQDTKSPLDEAAAVSIAGQVLRGLAEAHERQVVHRDIKPSNILLTPQGVVKIVDFGLAAMPDGDQLTQTGTRMGTPAYMSPEQALGNRVDARSDLWSLAVVLLEMLAREKVFRAEGTRGVLDQVVQGKIAALGKLVEPMRGIVARGLERDQDKRWQTAGEFLSALEGCTPKVRRPRRHLLLVASALILMLAATGGAWLLFRGTGRVAGAPRSTSIFDKYRQSMELMNRWDKDGNLARATQLLTECVQTDPTFALGFARLAEANRLSFALSRNPQALEVANRNAEEALRLNPELASVQVVWGRVQALRGNNDLAMASFERAVRIDPNDSDAQMAIARQYERLGRLKDAEAAFQKATHLEPDGIAPHDFYANFLYRQGQFDEAIREWQTVLRIAPDHTAAWVNLGAAAGEAGRLDEAIAAYNKALELKPNDMAFNNLGAVYGRTGRNAEAVEAYRKAIEMNAGNYLFVGNLGMAYDRMKNEQEARVTLLRAIELGEKTRKENPRDALVQRRLAAYYAHLGNASAALDRIGTALALAPKSPEIQAGAAEVYEVLGQRKMALAMARRAMALGYSHKRLEQYPELARLLPELK